MQLAYLPMKKRCTWVAGKYYGAVKQQNITWANIGPDLYSHMASLGHNELSQNMILFWKNCTQQFCTIAT